MINTKV